MKFNVQKYLIILGHLQYVVLTATAMQYYPGGTIWDKSTQGYIFHLNFFSDLGMDTSLSGIKNKLSPVLFLIAHLLISLSQIPFYLGMYRSIKTPSYKLLRTTALLFGLLSAVAILGIGVFPHDIRELEHMAAVILWLLGFLVALFIHCYIFMRERSYKKLLYSAPLITLIFWHIIQQRNGWTQWMPLSQKLVVYYMIAWFITMTIKTNFNNLKND